MDLKLLKEPFKAQDIEWRMQSCGEKNNKVWGMVLAYVTNRAIMDRLDEVCGPDGWSNEFKQAPEGGILCGISIKCEHGWITKWDGAENTAIESVKGGLSSAQKRAGVQWGIGRYLYNLEATFIEEAKNGKHYQPAKQGKNPAFKWNDPFLPAWALPKPTNKKLVTKVIDDADPYVGKDKAYYETHALLTEDEKEWIINTEELTEEIIQRIDAKIEGRAK